MREIKRNYEFDLCLGVTNKRVREASVLVAFWEQNGARKRMGYGHVGQVP